MTIRKIALPALAVGTTARSDRIIVEQAAESGTACDSNADRNPVWINTYVWDGPDLVRGAAAFDLIIP